jgi:hypothetical protein
MWILTRLSQCLLGAEAFNFDAIAGRLKLLRDRYEASSPRNRSETISQAGGG